jgi:hypothetical protein
VALAAEQQTFDASLAASAHDDQIHIVDINDP